MIAILRIAYPPDRISSRSESWESGRYPDDRYPRDRYPDDRYPDSRDPNPSRRGNDNISVMLDNLYRTADQYLQDLAMKSGGELHRADTLGSLPDAFANIAAELRNQYSLGYYPANQTRDGKYRKIQVKVSRKNVVDPRKTRLSRAGREFRRFKIVECDTISLDPRPLNIPFHCSQRQPISDRL